MGLPLFIFAGLTTATGRTEGTATGCTEATGRTEGAATGRPGPEVLPTSSSKSEFVRGDSWSEIAQIYLKSAQNHYKYP